MKKKKYPPDLEHARRVAADEKNQRIKRAAELSQTQTAIEIERKLGISKRTLQRYTEDLLWQEHGGRDLTFTEHGRPVRDTLSASEKQTLTEAHSIYQRVRTWGKVAEILEIPLDRLKYLLRYSNKSASELRYDPDIEKLKKALELRDQGLKWKDIPDEIGITWNQLRYIRRKYADTLSELQPQSE